MSKKANLLSVGYAGPVTKTYPALETRKGPAVIAESGAVATISYGVGGSNVPVGAYTENLADHTDVFAVIVTSGTVHVITDDHSGVT